MYIIFFSLANVNFVNYKSNDSLILQNYSYKLLGIRLPEDTSETRAAIQTKVLHINQKLSYENTFVVREVALYVA